MHDGLSRIRIIPLLVVGGLALVACGGGDDVSGFDADTAPISADLADALGPGVDPDAVPAVQRTFLEWCVKGGADGFPDLPAVQREGLLAVCGCTYEGIVDATEATVRAQLGSSASSEEVSRRAFDVFEEIDADVRAGGEVPDELVAVARRCIRAEAGL